MTAEELDGVLAEAERHMDRLECEELRYLDRMADEQTIKVLKAELARREWLTKGANGV